MTTKRILIIALVAWVASGIFNYGALLADWEGNFPSNSEKDRRRSMGRAGAYALIGPFGTPVAVFGTGFLYHGWRLTVDKR